MRRVFLVSCVGRKAEEPRPAEDLYTSPWFRKARAFVERRKAPWFILSAEYGLLHPDALVSPYERTLSRMGVGGRRAWAAGVWEQLRPIAGRADHIVFLAGRHYRDFLIPYLEDAGMPYEVPMAGMSIGQQLQYMTRDQPARLSHLRRFYELLEELEKRIRGRRRLEDGRGEVDWPARGVYFFMEESEARAESGSGLRVTRVGTHALVRASTGTH